MSMNYFKALIPDEKLPFLNDIMRNPDAKKKFLESVPKEYKSLFAVPVELVDKRPDLKDITFMEMTAIYNKRVDARSTTHRIILKLFNAKTNATLDYNNPVWCSQIDLYNLKTIKGLKRRNDKEAKDFVKAISDQDMKVMEDTLILGDWNHVGLMRQNKNSKLGSYYPKSFFVCNIDANKISQPAIMFEDANMFVPDFFYKETNNKPWPLLPNGEIFARSRWSIISDRVKNKSTITWNIL